MGSNKEDINMGLWDRVFKTDPDHTKEVRKGSSATARKFTAIDAYYQFREATRQFGPCGSGWGWKNMTLDVLEGTDRLLLCKMEFWHGSPDNIIPVVNAVKLEGKYSTDEDAPKKAMTGCITKALSYLGFNGDVFLGMFDDNQYVDALYREKKEAEREEPREPEPTVPDISSIEGAFANFAYDHANAALRVDPASSDVKTLLTLCNTFAEAMGSGPKGASVHIKETKSWTKRSDIPFPYCINLYLKLRHVWEPMWELYMELGLTNCPALLRWIHSQGADCFTLSSGQVRHLQESVLMDGKNEFMASLSTRVLPLEPTQETPTKDDLPFE